MAVPTVEECRARLGKTEAQLPDEKLSDILAGEIALQASICAIPEAGEDVDTFPVALRNSLFRRVQRALAMDALPLAVLRGDAEIGTTYLPSNDPEVRRLEGPYRLVTFA